MNKNKGIIALFILGMIIVATPHLLQMFNNFMQKKQVEKFISDANGNSETTLKEKIAKTQKCNEEVYADLDGFHDPFEEHQEKLIVFNECLGVTDDDVFAALEIPKLKLIIPIYLGSSEEVLSKGVGQVEGSSLPLGGKSTHTVLAGHRGMWTKKMFRDIEELHRGDVFYIHTLEETLTYEVYQQKVIYPYQTDDLEVQENKDIATLLTCHPYRFNYQRLLIQAERTHNSPPT